VLLGASGKLVGIGSSFPSAKALARMWIYLEVGTAESIALTTTSQLQTSVDILNWIKDIKIFAIPSGAWRKWNPPQSRKHNSKTRNTDRARESFRRTCDQLSTPHWSLDSVNSATTNGTNEGINSLHLDSRQVIFSYHQVLDMPTRQRSYLHGLTIQYSI